MTGGGAPDGAGIEARVRDAVAAIRARTDLVPRAGFTLGSGLGGVIDALEDAVTFDTATLPHWPRATVPGHAGRLSLGRWAGLPVVALSGRSHVYEGYPLDRVTLAVRVMRALGATALVFTNAVGAIARELSPGDLVLLSDHVNFIGTRGLFSPGELAARGAGRPVAARHAPRLRAAAVQAGVPLRQGVLVAGRGPSYETAAEIRMGAAIGADVAGMSTAHEVTLAAELGCEAACLSCVTNMATGISITELTHAEVAEVAVEAAVRLRAILEAFVRAEARA